MLSLAHLLRRRGLRRDDVPEGDVQALREAVQQVLQRHGRAHLRRTQLAPQEKAAAQTRRKLRNYFCPSPFPLERRSDTTIKRIQTLLQTS